MVEFGRGRSLAALARDVEELAGGIEDLRRASSETRDACRKELLLLPSPASLCERHDTGEKQLLTTVAATLVRLGLAPPRNTAAADAGDAAVLLPELEQHSSGGRRVLQELPSRFVAGGDAAAPFEPRPRTRPGAATAAELIASLRSRMAARVQRAWRCFSARRELRRKTAIQAIFHVAAHQLRRSLVVALRSLRQAAASRTEHAATQIARRVRGWLGRRRAGEARRRRLAVAGRRRHASLKALAATTTAWAGWPRCAQRRRRLAEAAAGRPPPRVDFWRLFPSDGKTAVAQAQRDWVLQRRAVAGWLQIMYAL